MVDAMQAAAASLPAAAAAAVRLQRQQSRSCCFPAALPPLPLVYQTLSVSRVSLQRRGDAEVRPGWPMGAAVAAVAAAAAAKPAAPRCPDPRYTVQEASPGAAPAALEGLRTKASLTAERQGPEAHRRGCGLMTCGDQRTAECSRGPAAGEANWRRRSGGGSGPAALMPWHAASGVEMHPDLCHCAACIA